MRRKKQALSASACAAVLKRGTAGVLAVLGEGGYPYAVPPSCACEESAQKLYFPCARTGHRLDAIARHSQVSFCAVDKDQVMPQQYTTCFRSVVVFGRARVLQDVGQKRAALEPLAARYAPDDEPGRRQDSVAPPNSAEYNVIDKRERSQSGPALF